MCASLAAKLGTVAPPLPKKVVAEAVTKALASEEMTLALRPIVDDAFGSFSGRLSVCEGKVGNLALEHAASAVRELEARVIVKDLQDSVAAHSLENEKLLNLDAAQEDASMNIKKTLHQIRMHRRDL